MALECLAVRYPRAARSLGLLKLAVHRLDEGIAAVIEHAATTASKRSLILVASLVLTTLGGEQPSLGIQVVHDSDVVLAAARVQAEGKRCPA